MIRLKVLCAFLVLFIILFPVGTVNAVQSSGFTYQNGDWYDSFNIDRNQYSGPNGYLPNLAYETLNSNAELAFSLGASFKESYSSATQRAEAILQFVQTWTDYGYDSDNVVKDGVPQEEWAWNADEMAHRINQDTGVKAVGDCEDLAFLCATLYEGAGFDAAVVDAPDHAALVIWLPEYSNANYYWDLPDDNRDAGWIWVEATGSSNPLGWTPPDFSDGNWNAYPVSLTGSSDSGSTPTPPTPVQQTPQPQTVQIPAELIAVGVIALTVMLIIVIAASKRKSTNQLPPPPPPPQY
jgi:hypothetical protein